jgi:hypothetical protein
MKEHPLTNSENKISHKIFIEGTVVLMIVIGLLSLYAAISFGDPFYYLPSIPIAIGAFFTAAVLIARLLQPSKRGPGLYLGIYVIVLLVSSSFIAVAVDYGHRLISREADFRIMCHSEIKGMEYLDRERAQFSLTIGCSNYYYSEISVDHIEIKLYYMGTKRTRYLALQDRWSPDMRLQPEKGGADSTTMNIIDPGIVAKMFEQGILMNQKVEILSDSLIWFDTPDGLLKKRSISSGYFSPDSR